MLKLYIKNIQMRKKRKPRHYSAQAAIRDHARGAETGGSYFLTVLETGVQVKMPVNSISSERSSRLAGGRCPILCSHDPSLCTREKEDAHNLVVFSS